MSFIVRVACWVILLSFLTGAEANEWANSPNKGWFAKQMPTPSTLKEYEIGWKSCCDHGDVCQDCVVYRAPARPPWKDVWLYEKDGVVKELPPHTVEYVPWTPSGKPVLFRAPFGAGKMKVGDPVCLKVPGGAT